MHGYIVNRLGWTIRKILNGSPDASPQFVFFPVRARRKARTHAIAVSLDHSAVIIVKHSKTRPALRSF
ncbi:hypothetical protein D3C75_1329230 [compost metagenome]